MSCWRTSAVMVTCSRCKMQGSAQLQHLDLGAAPTPILRWKMHSLPVPGNWGSRCHKADAEGEMSPEQVWEEEMTTSPVHGWVRLHLSVPCPDGVGIPSTLPALSSISFASGPKWSSLTCSCCYRDWLKRQPKELATLPTFKIHRPVTLRSHFWGSIL